MIVLQPAPVLRPGAGAVYHAGSDRAGGGMEPVSVPIKPDTIYRSVRIGFDLRLLFG